MALWIPSSITEQSQCKQEANREWREEVKNSSGARLPSNQSSLHQLKFRTWISNLTFIPDRCFPANQQSHGLTHPLEQLQLYCSHRAMRTRAHQQIQKHWGGYCRFDLSSLSWHLFHNVSCLALQPSPKVHITCCRYSCHEPTCTQQSPSLTLQQGEYEIVDRCMSARIHVCMYFW